MSIPTKKFIKKRQNPPSTQSSQSLIKSSDQSEIKVTSVNVNVVNTDKDKQNSPRPTKLQGILVKSNIIKTTQGILYISHDVQDALVGDHVEFEHMKPGKDNKLATAGPLTVTKRGSRVYYAVVVGFMGKLYKLLLNGSDHEFVMYDKNWFAKGTKLLVTFDNPNQLHQVSLVQDLSLYSKDEIIRKTYELEDIDWDQPIVNELTDEPIDQTQLYTFTIDPFSSKDFDDAISLQPEYNKFFVHIADVARFIKAGSKLDKRLRTRHFSVYLTNKVFHMSPSVLATDLCSLNPNVERYAATIEFSYHPETLAIDITKSVHYRSKIKSKRRFNYDEVNKILEDECISNEEKDMMLLMQTIYQKNKIDKFMREIMPEVCMVGSDLVMSKNKEDDSHEIVEFFMLLANQYVASTLDAKNDVMFPRRVHPPAFDLKKLDYARKVNLPDFCPPEFRVFLMLKCLPAVYYSTEKGSHFALNMSNYTHFTSPIRRYIDVVNHRLLFGDYQYTQEELDKICTEANEEDAKVRQAEQLKYNLQQCEWAEQHLQDTFTGIVYNISFKGISVYIVENSNTYTFRLTEVGHAYRQFFSYAQTNSDGSDGHHDQPPQPQLVGKTRRIQLYNKVKLKIVSFLNKVVYKIVA